MLDVDFAKIIENKFNISDIACYSQGTGNKETTCYIKVPLEKRDDFEKYCCEHCAVIQYYKDETYCVDTSNVKR